MTRDEKLQTIRNLHNPLGSVLSHIQYVKGDKGDKPSDEELRAVIRPLLPTDAYLTSLIRPLIPAPIPGHTPTDQELQALIRPLIPQVQDGETPTKSELLSLIKPLIPKPKNGTSPKIGDIVAELRKTPVNYQDIADAPDLTDLPKLIEFLKRGGFRGGGGGTGTVAIVYTETPSGLIDGINTTYTTAHTITNVYSFAINGQFLHPTTDYTFSGTTITMTTALPASLSGLPFTITYS